MLEGEVRPVDLILDDTGQVVVNNVHVGAGRAGQPPRRPLEGAARLHRRRQAQPRPDRLPDRRPPGRLQAAAAAPARRGRRRGRQRPRPARADGRGRQRHQRRRRRRADPRGGPRGRAHRRDGQPAVGPAGQDRVRRPGGPRPPTPSATTCSRCAGPGCPCPARSSTAPRTARSPDRSGSAPGGSSPRRTRWCCPSASATSTSPGPDGLEPSAPAGQGRRTRA